MNSQFNELVRCKYHPEKPITFIYCKKECPHQSRLACNECVVNYETAKGFQDLQDVLKNPRLIMRDGPSDVIYKIVAEYFDILEKDPLECFQQFKKSVLEQLDQLEKEMKQGLDKYNQFRKAIVKAQQQFNEALGQEKVNQAFKNILKVKDYHFGPEWNQLEQTVEKFIEQLDNLNNQEFMIVYQNISEIEGNFFQSNELRSFKRNILKYTEKLNHQIVNLDIQPLFLLSVLFDPLYQLELIKRIQNKKNGQPKFTLLFKGSVHGLNGKTFWEKCSNKGPTIVICKSKSGYVFGGYTPCKWLPNGSWQKDESKTSFVFSYTRKEIYPITTGADAIYCNSSYGPIFGGGHQFSIYLNFQDGYSNMDGKSYSSESYKIENPKTHLMGGEKPELVEMEVFLVE